MKTFVVSTFILKTGLLNLLPAILPLVTASLYLRIQSSWESKRKAMTRNQLERVERDGLPGEEIMRRAIEQVAANKPTMPEFIERLWSKHQIKAVVSYYSHGGVRGINFGIDIGSVNEDGSPGCIGGVNMPPPLLDVFSLSEEIALIKLAKDWL